MQFSAPHKMLALSYIFYVLSKCYLIPFLKLNIMILFEVLYNILYKFVKAKYSYRKSKEKKLAVITGGSKGIGMEVVRKLIDLNYDVVLLSRDTAAMSRVQKKYTKARVKYSYLDLSDLKSIAVTINSLKLENVDLLINNAGVYFREVKRRDNVELNMLINFVAHYLVTGHIDAKRVVNVSSSVVYSIKSIEERGFDLFMENYAQSKLANLQHTLYLKQKGVNCVAVHPGIVASGLFNNTLYGKFVGLLYIVMPFLFTSVNDAADNVLHACLAEDLSDDENVVDFYMYGQKAKVPDYVNNNNMLKLMKYAHNTIDSVIAKDK